MRKSWLRLAPTLIAGFGVFGGCGGTSDGGNPSGAGADTGGSGGSAGKAGARHSQPLRVRDPESMRCCRRLRLHRRAGYVPAQLDG